MNHWKVSTFVLTGVCALSIAYGSVRSAQAEPQPRMQQALESLQQAKAHLQAATADKGGHRVKAIALTNDAIDEVKKGIEFDNKH